MNQPGLVANPARGHLNRENEYTPLSPLSPENLVSRDRFGRSVPRQTCTSSILRLNLVLTDRIPPDFRDGVHI